MAEPPRPSPGHRRRAQRSPPPPRSAAHDPPLASTILEYGDPGLLFRGESGHGQPEHPAGVEGSPEAGPRFVGLALAPRKGNGKSVKEALEAFPDLLAMIDGTEQRNQRLQDDEVQRPHSSGRRKTHPRKTILAVDDGGYIRGVSPSAPGSPPDGSRTVKSGIIPQIPESISVIGDAGFDRLQNYSTQTGA